MFGGTVRIRAALAHTPRSGIECEVDRATFMIGRGPMRCGPNYEAPAPRRSWPLLIAIIVLWAPLILAIFGILGSR